MKLILTILLFAAQLVHGQMNNFYLVSGTGYPSGSNKIVTGKYHIPPVNPNGRKHIAVVFLHGQGERGTPGDTTTSNGTNKLYSTRLPSMVRYNPLPRIKHPYGGVLDSFGVAVFAPQCSTEYGTWPEMYTAETIKLIKTQFHHLVDTNRIILTGLSQGGGGGMKVYSLPYLSRQIASFDLICPGYWAFTNYGEVVLENKPLRLFHSQDDVPAPILNSDNLLASLMNATNGTRKGPYYPVTFIRLDDGGHIIWDRIYDLTPDDTYLMSNGETWTNRPTFFERATMFTTNGAWKP